MATPSERKAWRMYAAAYVNGSLSYSGMVRKTIARVADNAAELASFLIEAERKWLANDEDGDYGDDGDDGDSEDA